MRAGNVHRTYKRQKTLSIPRPVLKEQSGPAFIDRNFTNAVLPVFALAAVSFGLGLDGSAFMPQILSQILLAISSEIQPAPDFNFPQPFDEPSPGLSSTIVKIPFPVYLPVFL